MKDTFNVLWRTFAAYRWHIAVLVILGFVGAILEGIGINAAIPLVSFLVSGGAPTDFISHAVASVFGFLHIPFTFRFLLGFIVGLFIVRAVAAIVFGYVRGYITADFLNRKSQEMLQKTFAASWPFLLRQKLGHIHNTLVRDVQSTSNLLEVVGQVIQSFTGLLMYLAVAINISPLITLATVVGGAVLLFIVRPFMRRMRESGDSMAKTEKEVSQFLSEHILGMKAVKASAAEASAFAHSRRLFEHMRKLYVRMAVVRSLSASLFQPFSIFFVIILFTITYNTPSFNLIAFAATLYLIQKIFTYLESGNNALASVNALVPYARNIEDFKTMLERHEEAAGKGSAPFVFDRAIEFKNISLAYNEEVTALQEVNFVVDRGETVAFIGPSGAGKTSVVDLFLRLFEPTGGSILVDGKPLADIAGKEWREHVGYVAQDVFLLNGTIGGNIRFYHQGLGHEDIVVAAKQANIYDFVVSLKDGFDTVVGDRGVMLSGGQRQRVVLARALARKPALLILDEATSALDTESERLIQAAIKSLHGQVTVLIVAHRLSTVEAADKIVVLDRGRILESGSPQELRARPGSYFAKHS